MNLKIPSCAVKLHWSKQKCCIERGAQEIILVSQMKAFLGSVCVWVTIAKLPESQKGGLDVIIFMHLWDVFG